MKQISQSLGRDSGRLWPKYSVSSQTARLTPLLCISTFLMSSLLSMSVESCRGVELSEEEDLGHSFSLSLTYYLLPSGSRA